MTELGVPMRKGFKKTERDVTVVLVTLASPNVCGDLHRTRLCLFLYHAARPTFACTLSHKTILLYFIVFFFFLLALLLFLLLACDQANLIIWVK